MNYSLLFLIFFGLTSSCIWGMESESKLELTQKLGSPFEEIKQKAQNATEIFTHAADGTLTRSILEAFAAENDINTTFSSEGYNLLQIAVARGHYNTVRLLLSFPDVNINQSNELGLTALAIAVALQNKKMVELLLRNKNSDPNAHNLLNGDTLLHLTARLNNPEITQLLIDRGARTSEQNYNGSTPLHTAAESGSLPVAAVLLSHGNNINSQTSRGVTPLHIAVRHNHLPLALFFLGYGADPNIQDEVGNTPLHVAAKYADTKFMEKLIKHGAYPFISNNEGKTPLEIAAEIQDIKSLIAEIIKNPIPGKTLSVEIPTQTAKGLTEITSGQGTVITGNGKKTKKIPLTKEQKEERRKKAAEATSKLLEERTKSFKEQEQAHNMIEQQAPPGDQGPSSDWQQSLKWGGGGLALGTGLYLLASKGWAQQPPTGLSPYHLHLLVIEALKNKHYEYAYQLMHHNPRALRELSSAKKSTQKLKDAIEKQIDASRIILLKESAKAPEQWGSFLTSWWQPALPGQLKLLYDISAALEHPERQPIGAAAA